MQVCIGFIGIFVVLLLRKVSLGCVTCQLPPAAAAPPMPMVVWFLQPTAAAVYSQTHTLQDSASRHHAEVNQQLVSGLFLACFILDSCHPV